jgi:quinol monooxygenase YgiN
MNRSRFTGKLFLTAVLFVLCSCGGNEEKPATETAAVDTTATTPAPQVTPLASASTIITAPQYMMVVRHKVADYEKFKTSYDSHDSLRLANGLHNYVIGRSLDDSSVILVALKADDIAKAKAFAKNPALKKAMEQAGVKGPPTIMFLNSIYQNTAEVSSNIRSMSIMTVKDRDAWFKSFEEFKQEREDNGIADRVISQDPDNDKKMILVTAWTDTAKAKAYIKSDVLKKRREASGVIGEPERFVFQVLKRY